MAETFRHIAGAMSGTSADGVDIAITRITGCGLDMSAQLVSHHHRPYTTELRREIFAFRSGEVRDNPLARLAKMGREISLTYAAATNEALAAAGMQSSQLAAIAAHGQTLFHDPPDTIQWLDPSLITAEVGCPVVSDFRRADLAAGGQGAPLVPFADYILFRHATKNRVLLNIGGIANITWLAAGGQLDDVYAFDTGPGNCISDHVMRLRRSSPYDAGGDLASLGRADRHIVYGIMANDYFLLDPPKSTDTPQMIRLFEQQKVGQRMTVEDELATACALTARSIADAIGDFGGRYPDEVIVSGGGSENKTIMKCLGAELSGSEDHGIRNHVQKKGSPIALVNIDTMGVSSSAKEALAFALLAAATLDGVPSNVPSVTGARRPVVLGSITPAP